MRDIQIDIVAINAKDVVKLRQIGEFTFREAFSEVNTEENMDGYIAQKFNLEKIRSEYNNPESQFYFAKVEDEIIGYLKLNTGKAQTETTNENALEIERIYVLKTYHGNKVGQLLFKKALEIAYKIKVPFIWLGVWQENVRAIKFYEKNGFVTFDKRTFILGTDVQTDFMMKLNL